MSCKQLRHQVRAAVLDSDLPLAPRRIMVALCTLAGRDGKAWPGRRQLARITGLSPTTVWRYLAWLTEHQWLDYLGEAPVSRAAAYRIRIPDHLQARERV